MTVCSIAIKFVTSMIFDPGFIFFIQEPLMPDMPWSATEKKIARRVFDAALQSELADIMADFKARAVRASTPDDLWAI